MDHSNLTCFAETLNGPPSLPRASPASRRAPWQPTGRSGRRRRGGLRCLAVVELASIAPAAGAAATDVLRAGAVLQSSIPTAPLAHSQTLLAHAGAAAGLPRLWFDLAEAATAAAAAPRDDGWLTPIAQGLDWLLLYFRAQLNAAHVPYASGWAIVCLTLVTKTLTFPFTKIQVESALSTQKLKPTIDAIKRLYGDDKDKIQRETSELYKKSGVSPTAGCLPTLATIPVFWGLYRTLSNASSDGALTGGFYWLPDLAGPTSLAAQKAGAGISWVWPLVDGAPPVGWETAARYLVLPALLVAAQYASSAIISPPVNTEDDDAKTTKTLLAFLPLMVGYFALNVPSGLSLYYFANTVITSGQQIWLRKLGGATAFEWQEEIGVNQARRTGPVAEPVLALQAAAAPAAGSAPAGSDAGSAATHTPEALVDLPGVSGNGASLDAAAALAGESDGAMAQTAGASGNGAVAVGNGAEAAALAAAPLASEAEAELARRCKRKKNDREKDQALQGVAG